MSDIDDHEKMLNAMGPAAGQPIPDEMGQALEAVALGGFDVMDLLESHRAANKRLRGKLREIAGAIGLQEGGGTDGYIVPNVQKLADEHRKLKTEMADMSHAFHRIGGYLEGAVNDEIVDMAKLRNAYDTACLPEKAEAIYQNAKRPA